ncbi:alpha-1,6-mannosyl-glycoprotein 2-beta-N-acetylglucosaminyltransferase [Leptinotarsa decemlineata]|uniref:alpha-1,6-mannosyl-glycoprotein 2-beta-N-acetylglucosaminyltransferase n=1 Tax=Leptinotarsa decemlineata TaxID=7539 RepID=UPI003D30C2D6
MWHHKNVLDYIRTGSVIFLMIFIWLHLNFSGLDEPSSKYSKLNNADAVISSAKSAEPPITSVYEEILSNMPNISTIKRKIAQYNQEQVVHNEHKFQPLRNDSVVIVVQVHDRIAYLRHLVASLARAFGISEALLVFSHDFYDEEINSLVKTIDFCKVTQMFYPYSTQTHPREFPGDDPRDCPRDMTKEEAVMKKCNNALYPDVYGHYREAKFAQIKHHWWWKANRIFSRLKATENHTGPVVFLEEDQYVAEDFIYMLKLMEKHCRIFFKHCNILSLGTYLNAYDYRLDSGRVDASPWIGGKHNMGMAFNRSTWNQIAECATDFCEYDDYNWDWSLQHLSQRCLKHELQAVSVRAPRVFHIGECGVHHAKNDCGLTSAILRVERVLKSANSHLYPGHLILGSSTDLKSKRVNRNGGWGDRRDHRLCLDMTIR